VLRVALGFPSAPGGGFRDRFACGSTCLQIPENVSVAEREDRAIADHGSSQAYGLFKGQLMLLPGLAPGNPCVAQVFYRESQ